VNVHFTISNFKRWISVEEEVDELSDERILLLQPLDDPLAHVLQGRVRFPDGRVLKSIKLFWSSVGGKPDAAASAFDIGGLTAHVLLLLVLGPGPGMLLLQNTGNVFQLPLCLFKVNEAVLVRVEVEKHIPCAQIAGRVLASQQQSHKLLPANVAATPRVNDRPSRAQVAEGPVDPPAEVPKHHESIPLPPPFRAALG